MSLSQSGGTDQRDRAIEDLAWDAEWACTHCGGEGLCWDGSDPLGDCPDEPHPCHACDGSGRRDDQRIF